MKGKCRQATALLLIPIFLMSHLALAPAIPELLKAFRKDGETVDLAAVETLVTIPAMMIMIFVLVSNLLVARIGKKRTVQLGLVLIALSGVLSFVTMQYRWVFVGRLLLGAGIGLYNSLTVSLISDYFEGGKRAKMIGWRTASLNLGKAVTTFLVSHTLFLGTQYVFLVYTLAVPVLWYFSVFIDKDKGMAQSTKQSFRIDGSMILWLVLTFLIGLSYIGATIKIPTLLQSRYHYTTEDNGNLLSLLAASGIVAGLFYGSFSRVFKKQTIAVMLGMMALGNVSFIFGNNKSLFIVGAMLIGFSFVGGMSAIFEAIAERYHQERLTLVTSLAITAGNIGVILAPLLLTVLLEKLGTELLVTPFYITGGLMVIGVSYYWVSSIKAD